MLSPLDRVSANGTICKFISIACYSCHNVRINIGMVHTSTSKFDFDHVVPDSGATSHMRRNRMDFDDDYVTCNDIFMLMSDSSEIPVLGFGPSRIKIDGHII